MLLGSLRYQCFNYVNYVFVFNVYHIMIRSGKSLPRTKTSSKRVLSSTSPNSPLHEGKKTKTFTSPNRFAVLASTDTVFDAAPPSCEVTVPSSLPSDQAEPAAPPIYIRNINNFSAFKDVLIKTIGPKGFTCKSTPSYLIVRYLVTPSEECP
jgi:hypothetical protein